MTKFHKITRVVALLIIIVSIMGCGIGFNKTLFFTKSNVGLDIDSRPPTAEVTISRREGVIAPTFEDGKTPPVLASFTVDVNGISAFFGGISSTFAGGDAAVTMAKLYDDSDEEVEGKYTCADFDSSFKISQEPNYVDWFGNPDQSKKLLKKGEIEPFIFGTDTSFGLKVAWSGITAQAPDTVKLGFNRKEFALAPVTSSPIPDTTDSKVRMPSFLATIDNSTKLGSMKDSKIQHLQYFATGKAANLMALREAVRKAMISRLDPVAALSFREGLAEDVLARVLTTVYDGLTKLSKEDPPDIIAAEHLRKLDEFAKTLEIPQFYHYKGLIHYTYGSKDKILEITTKDVEIGEGGKFSQVIRYWDLLHESIKGAQDAKKAIDDNISINLFVDDDAKELSEAEVEKLNSQLLRHTIVLKELGHKLRTNSDVIAAYRYFVFIISPE